MEGDGFPILISADRLRARVGELGQAILASHPPGPSAPPLVLVGVLQGAFMFLADLVRAIPRDLAIDFVGARSYGAGTESRGHVEVTHDVGTDLAGADVLLVEDIVDSGRTLTRVRDHLLARRPRRLETVVLLDKPSRRVVPFAAEHVGFEIPDRFVVGYGLDHAGRYRNLPDVRVLDR